MVADTAPKRRRTYRGESLPQRRARRRETFLRAGKAVFGDRGVQAATLRGICREAGLTERYFYESFDNPLDLFATVYDRELDRLREVLARALADAPRDTEALTRRVITAYYAQLRDDPRLTRILIIEVYGTVRDMQRLYRRGIQDFADMIRDLIAARIEPDTDDRLDPDLIATCLVGAAIHLATRWYLSDYAEPLETIVANCMAVVTGVGRGGAAPLGAAADD